MNNWAITGTGTSFVSSDANNTSINSSSSTAWGIYSGPNSGNYEDARRQFATPFVTGNVVSFQISNDNIQTSGVVGMKLLNASQNALMQFSFTGGATNYTLTDNTTTTTAIPYTTGGLTVVIAYPSANTYNISVTNIGGSILYYYAGRTFSTATGGQIPDYIDFFSTVAGGNSTYDFSFNNISFTPTYIVNYTGNGNTGGTVPSDANKYISGSTVTSADSATQVALLKQVIHFPAGIRQ